MFLIRMKKHTGQESFEFEIVQLLDNLYANQSITYKKQKERKGKTMSHKLVH